LIRKFRKNLIFAFIYALISKNKHQL